MMKEISTRELKSRMEQGHRFVLLDVRGDEYFDEEHIPGAVSAPLGHIGEGIECCVIKDAEIIAYCDNKDCTMSEEGVKRLEDLGFMNVFHYGDGLQGWKDAGFRTVVMRENKIAA